MISWIKAGVKNQLYRGYRRLDITLKVEFRVVAKVGSECHYIHIGIVNAHFATYRSHLYLFSVSRHIPLALSNNN